MMMRIFDNYNKKIASIPYNLFNKIFLMIRLKSDKLHKTKLIRKYNKYN